MTKLPMPEVTVKPTKKKLVEVADLDNVLAYKGNYMVFALKENNYITPAHDAGLPRRGRGAPAARSRRTGQLQHRAAAGYAGNVLECIARTRTVSRRRAASEFKQMLMDRLTSSRKDNERVIVPTNSLYIECLVGTHPLLEDFKLIHRALDVKKVQAEVRRAELENIRLAARALEGEREDPDIEKKIVIEGGKELVVDTE